MSDDAESCSAVGLQELVRLRPAVEADAEGIVRQDAVHLCECGLEPAVVIVVPDDAPVTRLIARNVRRVREDEIDAAPEAVGRMERQSP